MSKTLSLKWRFVFGIGAAILLALGVLAAPGFTPEAEAGGTGGNAIPFDFQLSTDSQFVETVFLQVTAGWLNAPHSVSVTITSVNGDPAVFFDHGTTEAALADLEVFGDILQGTAIVILPFDDQHLKENHTTYTICAHVIFGGQRAGAEICETLL